MTKKKELELDAPLSANERFLYAVAVRLDVLIEQVSSIIDHIAKEDEVAVTESKVETVKEEATVKATPAKTTASRKRTKK